MDENALRRVLADENEKLAAVLRGEMTALRDGIRAEMTTMRDDLRAEMTTMRDDLRAEIRASEERLAAGGRLQFRQLADLYRATLERIEATEKHLGDQIGQTRGAIEALRASIERQDFRADELGRRVTVLETRDQRGEPPDATR
jgi:hypothetical protein